MRATLITALLLVVVCAVSTTAHGKKTAGGGTYQRTSDWSSAPSLDKSPDQEGLNASAAATTLILASYKFDSGATCTVQGWTTVDLTTQTGDYWHVDDFAPSNSLGTIPAGLVSYLGISFNPVQGAKSMWMGQRIPPVGPIDFIHCGYVALPGYGNGWNQAFCSKDCLTVAGGATTNLDIAFKIKFDTEPSYDATGLEYTTDCSGDVGWTEIDGGNPEWTGADSISVSGSYPVGPGPVKVRLHFTADTAWSNQDGFFPGFGVAVDSLSWETKPVEDFEGEAIGAHAGEDWQSCNTPGFGNYLALFKKTTGANYEDPCTDNLSCYWAAINGSTEFYTCGVPPQPAQRVVPHVNARGEYISNEIWSPVIPFGGTGTDFHLRYTVYQDLPLDNLIFHVWHVRTIGASGCPGVWKDRNFVHFADTKDWAVVDQVVGSKLDTATGVAMQAALGVIDMCAWWCGVFGTGACHSPAPYFDQVKVLRVAITGPQWDVRTIDTFQDTFSDNGTITGTARINSALDIKPTSSPSFTPGDSAIVYFLVDPNYIVGAGTNASGLLNDPNISTFAGRHKTKKQAYMFVTVWPQGQPGKSGEPLSEGPGGQANRYPFAGTQVIDGVTWTRIRMDFTYTGTSTNPGIGDGFDPFVQNRFNVDINDNLFTPGDTIYYFYGATSAGGTTYYSTEYGPTTDITAVAANAMEVTILPAGGFNRGGQILYVDGADGTGVETYYIGPFMQLGLNYLIDKYDVRGPSSGVSNRPAGRVTDVQVQLNDCYQAILWDCGSLPVTLGDGSGDPEKTDDYALLNTFLGNLTNIGGVYLMGDDVPEALIGYAGFGAVTFRSTYMPFTLINDNHRLSPTLFPISPTIKFWPGRAFNDDFVAFGGCPALNDFDVMGASGTSQVQMSYVTASSPNGAVIGNINGNARVLLAGFSLANVRDNELDGLMDRTYHLGRALQFLNQQFHVGAGDNPARSSLSQNYPNPFNPTTTIAFSLAAKGHVRLNVYNVSGQLVRTLANETRDSGAYSLTWDGRDQAGSPVSSGVYFYKLVSGSFSQTKKMVLLK